MDKVVLPKEVAEKIEESLKSWCTPVGLVFDHVSSQWVRHSFNEIELDTFIKALYIGYEVEQTPEDKVLQLYEFYKFEDERGNVYDGQTVAIIIHDVVDMLNIKIPGINA